MKKMWWLSLVLLGLILPGMVGCSGEDVGACEGETCSEHGTCSDKDGVAVCACTDGYMGSHCEACTLGYQDNDKDGSCEKDCPTAALSCGNHGHCEDTSGKAACVCAAGYAGALCNTCAAGFQDNDNDQMCQPDCGTAGLSCSNHGSCDDQSGAAKCVCEAGYVGKSCDACDTGYQDNDQNGSCMPTCNTAALNCGTNGQCDDSSGEALCKCNTGYQDNDRNNECLPDCVTAGLNCGAHGQCSDASGQALCGCETGYAGDRCGSCAEGYQDNDNNKICLPNCATAGLNCGANQHCDDATGQAQCKCDTGYQDNDLDNVCQPTCQNSGYNCGHGTCFDNTGTAVCQCQTGYDTSGGTPNFFCDICAEGYQDNDHNTSCLPSCALLQYTCSGIGQCQDDSGTASCSCPQGYLDDGQGNCVFATGHNCTEALPLLVKNSIVSGDTSGSEATQHGSCVTNTSKEMVYRFNVTQAIHIQFRAEGTFDSILYLRKDTCADANAEVQHGCNDDCPSGGLDACLDVNLTAAGTYFLFVDGNANNEGSYNLNINIVCPNGQIFDPQDRQCETDPCASSPCVEPFKSQCAPRLHETPDYVCSCDMGYVPDPQNPDACILDTNPQGETCADVITIPVQGSNDIPGSTSDAQSDYDGGCGGTGGKDRVYGFVLSQETRAEFIMDGDFDNVLYLRKDDCQSAGAQVICSDDDPGHGTNAGFVTLLAPGNYFLFVDGFDASNFGSYSLYYSLRSNPCANEEAACPGTPQCVPSDDWSSFECVCPAGTIYFGNDCVDDPCDPNPCTTIEQRGRCTTNPPDPPAVSCLCNPGYLPQDANDPNSICQEGPSISEWTVAVYLNADNNLQDFGIQSLEQMVIAGSSADVNVVVLLDTYDGPCQKLYVDKHSGANPSGPQGPVVGTTVLEEMGECDMGDWRTLGSFGEWAALNFSARHYAFIPWDHGTGWEKGNKPVTPLFKAFSSDDHPGGGQISVAQGDYANALRQISTILGKKIDIVGFDACFMGMWEVAEASRPYANILVASEMTIPAAGWPYDQVLLPLTDDNTGNPFISPLDWSSIMVDAYANASTSNETLAATDLNTLDTLLPYVSALANALNNHPDLFASIETVRLATQSFFLDEFRDLWDFASLVRNMSNVPADIQTAADNLITQLGLTIHHEAHQASVPGAHGLSIYFPSHSSIMNSAYRAAGAVWSARSTWDEFIDAFTQ